VLFDTTAEINDGVNLGKGLAGIVVSASSLGQFQYLAHCLDA
jgi:hypothetical protein